MQSLKGPDEIYGDLFEQVQAGRIFDDSKTFVDATPKADAETICAAFAEAAPENADAIRSFVIEHFSLPTSPEAAADSKTKLPVRKRIDKLWEILSRAADHVDPHSSLIELPRPYIVPGGRFREIFYWDSYFTMLGLAESGRIDAIEDMVENFAYLIDLIGFIPNGNRTYFCTRSQPPFFVLMVELLAGARDDPSIVANYLPQLRREYDFWMRGESALERDGDATRRVVKVEGGALNRYWDNVDKPRQESYAEDLEHAAHAGRDARDYYRNIRAAAESGWDFSSRWLAQPGNLETIRTTDILPVDLNALLYRLERCLATCYEANDSRLADKFAERASYRRRQLQTLFFDPATAFFVDIDIHTRRSTGVLSLAAAFPLFFEIATPDQAASVARRIHAEFLSPGGWVTTLHESGQQWDRPNGWAPLQWIVFGGFRNYGFVDEADEGARRWASDNIEIYERTGRLFEKYDVERVDSLAGGGEYDVQDGFGWTNGVLLKFMNHLNL